MSFFRVEIFVFAAQRKFVFATLFFSSTGQRLVQITRPYIRASVYHAV